MSRPSLSKNTAFGYPWSESKTSAKRSHVVRLRVTSLALYKLASWRLDFNFFIHLRFLVLSKMNSEYSDENSKNSTATRTCWELPVLGPVAYKAVSVPTTGALLLNQPSELDIPKCTRQLSMGTKNGRLSVHVCACAFFLCLHKSPWYIFMTGPPLQHQHSYFLRPKAIAVPGVDIQNAKVLERWSVPTPSLHTHTKATSFAGTNSTL